MAKFGDVSEETQAVFNKVIDFTELEQKGVEFKLISNETQKKVTTVVKSNEREKYLTNIDVIVIVNDLIFDQLPEELQEMEAMEALTPVHYDDEKDRVVLGKPDVTTFSGVLSKYGYEAWNIKEESKKSLYDKKKNDNAEAGLEE